jgi:hypothetical protein
MMIRCVGHLLRLFKFWEINSEHIGRPGHNNHPETNTIDDEKRKKIRTRI